MGIEENVTQVASRSVDAMAERPIVFGILILIGCFLGFTAWQSHDAADQNRQLLLKILEFRHNELLQCLDQIDSPSGGNPALKTDPPDKWGGPF